MQRKTRQCQRFHRNPAVFHIHATSNDKGVQFSLPVFKLGQLGNILHRLDQNRDYKVTTAGTSRCLAAFFCFTLYSSREVEQRYVRIDRIKNSGMWKEKISARTSLPVFPTSAVCPSIVARIAIPFAKSIHWTLPVFTAVFGSVLFKSMSSLSML